MKSASIKKDIRRNADLAIIHMAAKRLFGDVSKGSDGRDEYETWLKNHTGKSSAARLTTNERINFIKQLRESGLIEKRKKSGIGQTISGEERPTKAQWNKIGGLARSMGWNGLDDPNLHKFVRRTAKVENSRFMTRSQASKIILGLEEWLRQRQQHDGAQR